MTRTHSVLNLNREMFAHNDASFAFSLSKLYLFNVNNVIEILLLCYNVSVSLAPLLLNLKKILYVF